MQRGVDLAAPGAGRERDVVDQGTDGLGRLVALLWASERLGEPFHLPTIDARDVRMNIRRARQPLRQLVLLRLQLAQPRHEGTIVTAIFDDSHDFLDLFLDIGDRLPVRVAAGSVLAAERIRTAAAAADQQARQK